MANEPVWLSSGPSSSSSGPVWPNVERNMVAWLKAATGRPVFTETDSHLGGHLPAYQVERVGGGDGVETEKRFLVEVNTIGSSRPEVWDAVAKVETAMARLSSNGTAGWYVDNVVETFTAAIEPYDNTGKRRATATYELTIRPR